MEISKKITCLLIGVIITLTTFINVYATEIENETQDPIVDNTTNNEEVNNNTQSPENPPEQDPGKQPEEPPEKEPEPENPITPPSEENPNPEKPEEPGNTQEPEDPEKPGNSEEPGDIEKPEPTTPVVSNPTTNNNSDRNQSNNNTSNEEKKSSNNNLKSLEIVDIDIEPEFKKNITEYYITVNLETEKLEIKAIPEDDKAKVEIKGSAKLEEGENTVTITVTAEDKTTKTYKIFVTKTDNIEDINTNLKTLQVKDFDLYPNFNRKIYKYNLTINETIKNIEILAEAENEEATVEIVGNNELKEGNNTITIIVTAKDGTTKQEYKINTFISAFNVQVKQENKTPALIAIAVVGVCIIGLSIYIINKKRKNSV